jgi:hypothetical protein
MLTYERELESADHADGSWGKTRHQSPVPARRTRVAGAW